MRLLFVHDGPVFRSGDSYYGYAYDGLYERYSYLANDIAFGLRVKPLGDADRFSQIPEQVEIIAVPDFKKPSLYFRNRRSAERIIREAVRQSDVLVIRGSSCGAIATKYARRMGKPYIYECVGCIWDSLWNYSLLGKLLAPGSFLFERRRIREAPYVIYVTSEFLQQRYPTKGRSTNCSNVSINKPDETVLPNRVARIRSRMGSKSVVIGTAAAIDVRYKGQEYVIKAIKKLQSKGFCIEYRLAGGNRLNSNYLQKLAVQSDIEKSVVFYGSMTRNEMDEFYDQLDIYIQPSKQEGLPRSVIEAMSRGCPVLGSNIAGIPELIDNKWLFRKGNVSDIVDRIIEMLNSDLEAIAVRNYNEAKKYYADAINERRRVLYQLFMEDNGM